MLKVITTTHNMKGLEIVNLQQNKEILSIKLIAWLKWLIEKRPYIVYKGYHCGLCGKWVGKEFSIPKYKSCGHWGDTWGICINCKN